MFMIILKPALSYPPDHRMSGLYFHRQREFPKSPWQNTKRYAPEAVIKGKPTFAWARGCFDSAITILLCLWPRGWKRMVTERRAVHLWLRRLSLTLVCPFLTMNLTPLHIAWAEDQAVEIVELYGMTATRVYELVENKKRLAFSCKPNLKWQFWKLPKAL